MLAEVLDDWGGCLRSVVRLDLVLRSFGMHKAVTNYKYLLEELDDVIFSPPMRNGLFIEKMLSIREHHLHVSSAHAAAQQRIVPSTFLGVMDDPSARECMRQWIAAEKPLAKPLLALYGALEDMELCTNVGSSDSIAPPC